MPSPAPHVMIVEARFYKDLADELLRGATEALDEAGANYESCSVPGTFEIPAAIRYALHGLDLSSGRRRFDGYVALGCVIRGETTHYDHICQESARALMNLAVDNALAIGYGVLTCENREQAWERAARDRRNKGADAARACLRMIELKSRFQPSAR